MIYAVDGVPFPKPPDMSSIQYTDSQIVTDAQRTVGPVLHDQRDFWPKTTVDHGEVVRNDPLPAPQAQSNASGQKLFRLKYYDEGTGTIREGQFYSGDLTYTVKLADRVTQIPILYQDISWPFVER